MSTLIWIRHPECADATGRCYGRAELLPEATVLAAALRALQGQLPDWPVYSSPARRCLALARGLRASVQVLPDLQELDFGDWEGRLWDDIPRAGLDAWATDILNFRPGGAESAAEMGLRVARATKHIQHSAPQGAIVVSHAGPMRWALHAAGQINGATRWTAPIAHAHPYLLEFACPP